MDYIANQANISRGQTELILSMVFQILTGIIRDSSRDSKERVNAFKKKFLQRAIHLSIEILGNNTSRKCHCIEEEREKT